MKRTLITSALPYANGPLHFGHIAGVYLPADIYTRHLKLLGEKAIHISGSDEHGVAIMQNAQKAKVPYQEYVNSWHKAHKELFDKYEIKFDFFGQTSSSYHASETIEWFHELNERGFIEKKDEKQLQCQDCHNFLPDRFVEGTCYNCGYEKARGDECPNCGEWIDAIKLKNPVCKFCDSKNIEIKDSYQWYLMLSKYHKEYREWFESKKGSFRKTVSTYLDSLSKDEMVDRAITRDLDWGIDVPLPEAKGKKLYVWFDAPIGYVSNTKEYLKEINSNEDYLKDWWQNKDTEIVNFIGKDNIIFHGIIFPVMSMASGRVHPVSSLPANQYVNLLGKQFSKSQGWYVDSNEAIDEFKSDALRYYLTSLIPETNDTSFTWEGFEAKVNNELANNIGNFINRGLKFFDKNFNDGIEGEFFQKFFNSKEEEAVNKFFTSFHESMKEISLRPALEEIMGLGMVANTFFSDRAPWAEIKEDENKAQETIAISTVYAFILGVVFSPFLPTLSRNILSLFSDVTEDLLSKTYKGDLSELKNYFSKKRKLAKTPEGLVPKLDKARIKELDESLKNKKS